MTKLDMVNHLNIHQSIFKNTFVGGGQRKSIEGPFSRPFGSRLKWLMVLKMGNGKWAFPAAVLLSYLGLVRTYLQGSLFL